MTILYYVSSPDMDFFYFPDPPGDIYCQNCKCHIKPSCRPYRDREKKLKHDFQATYDGVRVVSERARDFLIANASTEIEFELIHLNAYRLKNMTTLDWIWRNTQPNEASYVRYAKVICIS